MSKQQSEVFNSLHGHSSVSNPMVIFSVYKDYESEWFNNGVHNTIKQILDALEVSYKEIEGCYNGIKEKSFIVNDAHIETAIAIAESHGQESILLLSETKRHGTRIATLLYLDTMQEEVIGNLIGATEERALKEKAYSYRPDLDMYWVTIPNDDLSTYAY